MSCAVWTPLYGANVVDGKRLVKRQAWVFLRCSGLMNFVDHINSHIVTQSILYRWICFYVENIGLYSSCRRLLSHAEVYEYWTVHGHFGPKTLRTLQFGAEVSLSSLSAELSCVTSFSKLFWTEMLSGTEISNHQYLCSRLDTLYGRTDVGLKCQVITVIIKV